MLLPEATRAWRKGVPTVIVMETGYDLRNTSKAFQTGINKHQEKFADFPDVYNRPKFGDMRYVSALAIQKKAPSFMKFNHDQ